MHAAFETTQKRLIKRRPKLPLTAWEEVANQEEAKAAERREKKRALQQEKDKAARGVRGSGEPRRGQHQKATPKDR